MSKYQIPQGMLEAASYALAREQVSHLSEGTESTLRRILLAVIQWWAENPIKPTHKDLREMLGSGWSDSTCEGTITGATLAAILQEWQRRTFLSDDVPDEIIGLMWSSNPYPNTGAAYRHDEAVKEAFLRGRNTKEQHEANLR